MQEKRRVLYKKGVFVCPSCRQSYVQEKWLEEWRIRCHRCTYHGTLTEVSVEEHMDEETIRR
jgi:Zn ribbon nucleic-acid-binding protein